MICPNKSVEFKDSVISKLVPVLNLIKERPCGLLTIYHQLQDSFKEKNEFLAAIDILYILGVLEINYSNNEVTYVKTDSK